MNEKNAVVAFHPFFRWKARRPPDVAFIKKYPPKLPCLYTRKLGGHFY
jgi:hypothetical protein